MTRSQLLMAAVVVLLAGLPQISLAQGLPVQYGLLPLGDLTTQDQAGPYAVPAVQAFEVEAALAAKTGAPGGPFTDADVLNFLANTECLEATFNTFAAFGAGLPDSLKPGPVAGGQRANLSPEVQSWAEEVALDEQGHVRMVREVLGDRSVPCPALDLTGGFRAYFDAATNMTSNPPFDPYKNDVNFLLATWSLEEIGSTGDKGCILLASNPGVSNCISGLATAASYQSGVDRHFLWQRRNETVPEYNMTVHQIVEAISNIRDTWDGPAETDQPLYNGNPNFIAVPSGNINLVPTDIRGLTFSRTPQQVLRIVTLGSETGKGGFFPQGLNGRINTPAGYSDAANAFGGYPGNQVVVRSLAEVNKTGLLNSNITVITPAPLPVQAEASGQQYNTTAVNSTASSPPQVALIGTAAPSPSPSSANTSTLESGPALDAGPANVTDTNVTATDTNTTGAGSTVTDTNTTAPAATTGNTTGADNATIVVVPVTTALNQTSTNISTSPEAALTTTPGAENATSTTTASPSPSPSPVSSPSVGEGATNGTGAVVVVPISTALNQTTTEISTSPAPAVTSTAEGSTSPSPSPSVAEATSPSPTGNTTGVIAPITTPAVAVTTSPSPSPTVTTTGTTTTASPALEGTTGASPSPNPTTLAVAVGNVSSEIAGNVTQAVQQAAETASGGSATTSVAASPAPGARKLRFMRRG